MPRTVRRTPCNSRGIVVFVSAALGFASLDLVNFSGFATMTEAQPLALDPKIMDSLPPIQLLVTIQILPIPIGALLNSV